MPILKPCLKGNKMMTAWEVAATKIWTKHRPRLVKYLREKGVLRQALQTAEENACRIGGLGYFGVF